MAKKKARRGESEFDKLARLIKEEGEEVREHMDEVEKRLNIRMDKLEQGLTAIIRRLDTIIQMQLDEHASRIKKLETAVFK